MINDARQARGDNWRRVAPCKDAAYDAKEFVAALVATKVTLLVAHHNSGRMFPATDKIAQTDGDEISQHVCRQIKQGKQGKQGFAWARIIGSMRQAMLCDLTRVAQVFVLSIPAGHLTRLCSPQPAR